jgi:UDP-glucose 4-epimerase
VATIAITGASGFIGREVAASVRARGHAAVPLSRLDLESRRQAALSSIDVLVHLAGRAHVLREPEEVSARAFQAVNVDLTKKVLGAAVDSGVRRFVFMSSAGVLGNVSSEDGIGDNSPPNPYDHYSRSKLEAEEVVKSSPVDRTEVVIVRPPMVYGPGARGNFDRILRAVAHGWPLPVGALRAPRSMIGLRNLCDFTLRASLESGAANTTMLASDDQVASVHELTIALARALGKHPMIFTIPVSLLSASLRVLGRSSDVPRLTAPFVVNAGRARELLGWTAPHTFLQEIEWTITRSIGLAGASRT